MFAPMYFALQDYLETYLKETHMIQPTVGRVVHYYRDRDSEVQVALIAHVNEDGTVNLAVFDHHGNPEPRPGRVMLVQEGNPVPVGHHCTWMPYQLGQAAKTQQLERRYGAGDVTTFASETQMNFGGVFAQSKGIVDPLPVDDTPVPVEAMGGEFDGGGASGDWKSMPGYEKFDGLAFEAADVGSLSGLVSISSISELDRARGHESTPVANAAPSYDARPSSSEPSYSSSDSSSSSSDSSSSSSSD